MIQNTIRLLNNLLISAATLNCRTAILDELREIDTMLDCDLNQDQLDKIKNKLKSIQRQIYT